MDLTMSIDTVSGISEKEFYTNYFLPQVPVIIKGLTNGTAAGEKWSLDYFKQTMGHHNVPLYDNRRPNNGSAYTVPDLHMPFGDFIDEIRKDETCHIRMFLYNLFKVNPKLSEEFPCPQIAKGVAGKMGFMFFAGKNTTVRIHYDIDVSNVFHTHFGGRKRVVLFSPLYNDLLYRLPYNTFSLVNIDKPDYEKYPALRYVQGYDLILEDRDTLFMPAGYWHYMTYLEGSFSVSYRKLAPTLSGKLEGALNLSARLWYDKMMNRFLGERWLEKKEHMAAVNAEKAMRNLTKGTRFAGI